MPATERIERIRPNFVNDFSELAEQRLNKLVEAARDLGVEIFSFEQGEKEILEKVRKNFPERFELVAQKLREEGLSLEDLPKEAMLDRLLGIDLLFTFQGKNYAVDVTSGKHSAIVNKEKKFQVMENLYRELGIDRALIIRLRQDITEEMTLDLFSKLEGLEDKEEIFSVVVKYPETPMKKTKSHL